MKEFADSNFKLVCKKCRKHWGKGEIANYSNFSFAQCFQKTDSDMYKQGLVGERVNSLPNNKFLDWSRLKAFADNKINQLKNIDPLQNC